MKPYSGLVTIAVMLLAYVTMAMTPDRDTINPEQFLDLIGESDKAAAKGDFVAAEEALSLAISLYPDNPHVPMLLSNIGMYRFQRGVIDSALTVLDIAAERAPRSVTIALNRADVLIAAGEDARAYKELDRVLTLDSTLLEPRMRRAMMALQQETGDMPVAENDLGILERLAPESYEAGVTGAAVALRKGEFARAASALDIVIKHDPLTPLRAQRAYCRLMTDDLPGASEDIAEGLRQCGDSLGRDAGEYYLLRSMLNTRYYRPDDAEADAKKAAHLLELRDLR